MQCYEVLQFFGSLFPLKKKEVWLKLAFEVIRE
jgi:hypothetical protein